MPVVEFSVIVKWFHAYGLADPADLNEWDYDAERMHAPVILIRGCRPDG